MIYTILLCNANCLAKLPSVFAISLFIYQLSDIIIHFKTTLASVRQTSKIKKYTCVKACYMSNKNDVTFK